jgi:hypothetical protein
LDVPPKVTKVTVKFGGVPAYWSYATCGSVDTWSEKMNAKSCAAQTTSAACSAVTDCVWNGEVCRGKEAGQACAKIEAQDPAVYGQEDCRCIGIDGRHPGKAFLYINDHEYTRYDVNVGSTCGAWEMESHPECQGAEKPDWCSMKWCFVDPCKCKVKSQAMLGPNQNMKFQGKVAHWSSETCGHKTHDHQKGTLGTEMQAICDKQEKTGVVQSGTFVLKPVFSLLFVLATVLASFAR